jgi:hypothetical protein
MMNDGSRIVSGGVAAGPRTSPYSRAHKIALYGFGSEPILHRNLIDLAAKENLSLTWCAILPTPHYRPILGEVLPANEILDIFRALPRKPVGGHPACLAHYPESMAEALAAQKRTWRRRNGRWLFDRGIDYYRLYKTFLADRGATHVLTSNLETPDAKILVSAARELGLGVMAPMDMRNMTGTFFSTDCYESPPAYAVADTESRAQAVDFIRRFRGNPTPAHSHPAEIASAGADVTLPAYLPPMWQRIKRFAKIAIERPDIFDYDQLRVTLMAKVTPLRNAIRGVRGWRNSTQYDIAEIEALPERFVFYPLQYSPEASINIPAPYFVDQMRAIDALRFAMPSDHVLVVKEHPACLNMRPVKFMRHLRKAPGVIVMKSPVPAVELIRRAALTVSVTGTAALEAFLLGRPASALGPGLSAWAIGRPATMGDLRTQILNAINNPVPDQYVIDQIAKLISVRYPFLFNPPHQPGEPMLRLHNMQRFLYAVLDHLEREHGAEDHASDPSHDVGCSCSR